MTGRKLPSAVFIGMIFFMGCATEPVGQMKADSLKQQLDGFIAKRPTKDDFLREYGFPSGCATLASKGELCEWLLDMSTTGSAFSYGHFAVASTTQNVELMRIEFGPHAEFVAGRVIVKDGDTQYVGGNPPPERPNTYTSDRWSGLPPPTRKREDGDACPRGEIYSEGKCSPIEPVGMSGAPR